MANIKRLICLPPAGEETFFLWGSRQSGKSTLLKELYAGAYWLDLLKSDVFRRYATRPECLREELAQNGARFVVVDEVQKVPDLLEEIHWLHENRDLRFALCGSSARRLKRGHANLLGGRVLRYPSCLVKRMKIGCSMSFAVLIHTMNVLQNSVFGV